MPFFSVAESAVFMTDIVTKQPLQRQNAASIDTSLPYKNVQAAVRLFGGKGGNAKGIKSHQKNGVHEMDIGELKEELMRVKVQIVEEQEARASVLSELKDLKKLLENHQAVSGDGSSGTDKKLADELKNATQHHALAFSELEEVKAQKNQLQQELNVALQEKDNAQRQAEEALAVAEVNAKRAEELSKEILGTKESLLLVKMACVETNKEREALWAARKAEASGMTLPESPNKLDHKLNVGRADFTKEDLRAIRRHLVSAREALANVDRLKAGCGSPVTDATIAIELEAAKLQLYKALESDGVLESTLKELQDGFNEAKQELDAALSELVEMRSREEAANSAIILLKSELEKAKNELKVAVTCNEAFVGFSKKLQKESTQEADEPTCKVDDAAKAELHALLKEEAEAVRQAELCQKTCEDACLDQKKDRLDTVHEDNNMMPSQNEGSMLSHDLHEESTPNAFVSEMRASYKEELRKKKFSLPSLSNLLSKSKRSRRKG